MKIALIIILLKSLNLSFEYRETNPNSLFPYSYAVSDTNPLGHLSNPSYLSLWNAAYLNLDYAKPYQMSELNSGNIRIGYSFSDMGIQIAWNRFGIKEYSEDILEGSFGYKPWEIFSMGLGVSYYHVAISEQDKEYKYGTINYKYSLLFLPSEWINIGFLQENIYSIINKKREDDSEFLFPNRSLGIAIIPADGLTFTWNINKIYYGYINSFSVTANMLPCLSLKGGYSRETSSYSFAVNLIYRKLSVSYGLSHHTYLGSTHKIGVTISNSDLVLKEINYNKSLRKKSLPEDRKRINVNECTYEELLDSNIFPKEIAHRIIKYRDSIGLISEKSLIQIGVNEKELKGLREFILGLAEEQSLTNEPETRRPSMRINKNKTKPGYDIDTRKLLFRKLLDNGINATTSLRIAEQAKNYTKNELIILVKESSDIDEEKKKIIIKICADSL